MRDAEGPNRPIIPSSFDDQLCIEDEEMMEESKLMNHHQPPPQPDDVEMMSQTDRSPNTPLTKVKGGGDQDDGQKLTSTRKLRSTKGGGHQSKDLD